MNVAGDESVKEKKGHAVRRWWGSYVGEGGLAIIRILAFDPTEVRSCCSVLRGGNRLEGGNMALEYSFVFTSKY